MGHLLVTTLFCFSSGGISQADKFSGKKEKKYECYACGRWWWWVGMTADHLDSDKTILHGRAIYPSTGEGRKGMLMMDGEAGSSFETGEMMDFVY